jgi:metal-responsive CopG/Arc/MetJ family transcriptional regulator
MGGPKIELDKALWARVQEHVLAAGYSSPEEFVQHVIERELAKTEKGESSEAAAGKIRGIGYIDAGLDI